jgi:uridine kinase
MNNYFRKYIGHLKNYYAIDEIVSNGKPKDVKQDSYFNDSNIRSYYKEITITLSPQAPDIDTLEHELLNKSFRKELIDDVGSIMNPHNYENGSTIINLKPRKNSENKCDAKIYYSPRVPVYDFQINDKEDIPSYNEIDGKKPEKSKEQS